MLSSTPLAEPSKKAIALAHTYGRKNMCVFMTFYCFRDSAMLAAEESSVAKVQLLRSALWHRSQPLTWTSGMAGQCIMGDAKIREMRSCGERLKRPTQATPSGRIEYFSHTWRPGFETACAVLIFYLRKQQKSTIFI